MGEASKRNIEAVDSGFIRAEVARQQLSYKDIAADLGTSNESLSRKANGQVPFSAFEIVHLADLLGCTTDKIFGRA